MLIRVPQRYRQEVFNVLLAQLLQERGIVTAPESVVRAGPAQARRIPDVIVSFYGLRTAIEGEVEDQTDAEKKAVASATQRVEDGVAHIGIAIVYPLDLRGLEFKNLKRALSDGQLRMSIVTESGQTGYVTGDLGHLERSLRDAFDQLVEEDVVSKAASILDAGVEQFAGAVMAKPGIAGRLAQTLGIRDASSPEKSVPEGESD